MVLMEATVIDITRIDGRELTINAELIESVDEVPDTMITLTTGKKIIVKESRQKIKNLVKLYKWDVANRVLEDEDDD